MAAVLQPETLQALNRLRTDFELYARTALRVRTKSGSIQPLILNRAQRHIHAQLEQQRERTGKVRALILKGRQQGCSTYVEARFFWRTVWSQGVRTFILTHEDAATANLFEMAQRYYEHLPEELKPSVNAQNAKELQFRALDSGYKVGTAGNKAVGRSSTIQLFHGSEVAFWPNAEDHAAGVLQTVPDEPGTEVVLESTANGIGNFYHAQWQMAERGGSDFIAVFVPWYWQEEYTRPVPDGFHPTADEIEYQEAYGLTLGQIAWRRAKLVELGESKFRQEYPANATEAFQTSGEDSLIKPEHILRARKDREASEYGPLVVGVDPARFGDDRTSIIRRRTRVAYGLESYRKKDNMEIAGICARILNSEPVVRMFIDLGGGAGVVDRLNELGYGDRVEGVNFGESALDSDRYSNRRAEMWGLMADWIKSAPCRIPDSDTLHADLIAPRYKFDSNSRLVIEKKEDIKKRGLASPDEADALALTFAAPVNPMQQDQDYYKAWR
ncbi:MAG TPA: hypothetical protein VF193_07565 [Steroidobacter sp.]